MADTPENDDQDLAEVFDETNVAGEEEDLVEAGVFPDLFDATVAVGDDDEEDEGEGDEKEELLAETGDPTEDLSPRTRLEDQPERGPATTRTRAAQEEEEAVSNADRENPNRFESRSLSEKQLRNLGYRTRSPAVGRGPAGPDTQREPAARAGGTYAKRDFSQSARRSKAQVNQYGNEPSPSSADSPDPRETTDLGERR